MDSCPHSINVRSKSRVGGNWMVSRRWVRRKNDQDALKTTEIHNIGGLPRFYYPFFAIFCVFILVLFGFFQEFLFGIRFDVGFQFGVGCFFLGFISIWVFFGFLVPFLGIFLGFMEFGIQFGEVLGMGARGSGNHSGGWFLVARNTFKAVLVARSDPICAN